MSTQGEDEWRIATENNPDIDEWTTKEVDLIEMDTANGSRLGAFFNVTNCAVGAGILSLPYAFATMGLAQSLVVFFVFVVAATLSLYILPMCAKAANAKSYEQTVQNTFGPIWGKIFKVIVVLYSFGVAVGYTVIIGDLLPPTIATWVGVDKYCEYWYFSKWFWELLVTVVILFPLACLRKLDSLRFTSMLAIFAVLYFTALSIIESSVDIHHSISDGVVETTGESLADSIVWWNLNTDVLLGIPIIAFAFGGHLQAISIYSELNPQHRTIPNWMKISTAATTVLSVIYILVGLLSYLRFLPGEGDNVLEQMLLLEPNNVYIQIASLAMSIVVILSYPLFTWSIRFSVDRLLFPSKPDFYDESPASKTWAVRGRYYITTVIIVVLVYLLAAFVGSLAVVFGLVGATGAVLIKYTIPLVLYLKQGSTYRKRFTNKTPEIPLWQRVGMYVLIVFWLIVGAVCCSMVLIDAYQNFTESCEGDDCNVEC